MSGKKRDVGKDAFGTDIVPGDIVITTKVGYNGTKSELFKATVMRIMPIKIAVNYRGGFVAERDITWGLPEKAGMYYFRESDQKSEKALFKVQTDVQYAIGDTYQKTEVLPFTEVVEAQKQIQEAEQRPVFIWRSIDNGAWIRL